jgi:hypothetical protein
MVGRLYTYSSGNRLLSFGGPMSKLSGEAFWLTDFLTRQMGSRSFCRLA